MKTKRLKIKLTPIHTRDEAESLMTSLTASVNAERILSARRDAEILAINKVYESGLATLSQAITAKTETLRQWAEQNPDQFPKGRKSIEMLSGILGFRTGTPKLALLSRAWNWEKVLQAVRATLPAFIRDKPEIDKEALIAQAADLKEYLPLVGVKVTQDESFFVEPKLTDLETRQTSEAA